MQCPPPPLSDRSALTKESLAAYIASMFNKTFLEVVCPSRKFVN
jgi:hypothetical protein